MLRLSAPRVCRQQHQLMGLFLRPGRAAAPSPVSRRQQRRTLEAQGHACAAAASGPSGGASAAGRPAGAPAAGSPHACGRAGRPPFAPAPDAAHSRWCGLLCGPHAVPHAVPAFPAVPARSLRSLHAVPMQPLRAAFSYPTTHPEGFLWWRCSNGMRRGRPRAAPAAGEGTARARTRGARRCARCGRLRPAGAGAPCARRGVPRCGAARLRGGLRRAGAGAAAAAARSHARPGAPACLCQRQILLAPARGHTRLQVARVQARRRPQRG